jgi:hypothetical protein
MASRYPLGPFELEVRFERRADGGLRARCEKVPGFLLSNKDPSKVLGDVENALSVMLTEMFGVPMEVKRLRDLDEAREPESQMPAHLCGPQSYVGLAHCN